MKKEVSEKELFETMPVPRAVATLAIPTIISQVVTMIYNLADTFFVGQIGDPYMVAAVSLVSPWFNLLTALGNLFGLGGGSLISRMLGKSNHQDIRHVSAFSVWGGAVTTLVFSLLTFLFRRPLLNFLGASPDTFGYAQSYLLWVVVLGGVPTMLSLTLGHLLRSEGHARPASAGMMFGGILLFLENSPHHVRLFCGLFRGLCPAHHASVHSGGANQHPERQLSADCLPGSAADVGEFSDQLHASGHGKRNPVGDSDLQPPGASEYSAADSHEYTGGTVRNDLDTAAGGSDYASGLFWNVSAYGVG